MEEKLKAMSTALPLVGDLAHPAMRPRHWEQLMKATGKTFVKDDKFSLGDLLDLGLHNYVDDCSEIVDRAQKVRGRAAVRVSRVLRRRRALSWSRSITPCRRAPPYECLERMAAHICLRSNLRHAACLVRFIIVW